MPLPDFSSPTSSLYRQKPDSRPGISELYASLLMIGVTLSMGSLVTGLAVGALSASTSSASFSSSLQAQSLGREVAYVDAVTGTPSTCHTYHGTPEGEVLTFAVLNYGTATFVPAEVVINGTVYTNGPFPQLTPGSMAALPVSLVSAGTCAHAVGQSVLVADASGDEFQFVS